MAAESREPAPPSSAIPELLAGQKAIVTGGSSGIGKAIALALGEAGADVLVNFHSGGEEAEKVAEQIQRGGRDAFAHGADVSKEEEMRDMFAAAIARFGRVDILVANSGLGIDRSFLLETAGN